MRPLAIARQTEGLNVWYDEFELKIGDSIRRKIDKGLANSRFRIVVLSKDSIKRGWTNYELDGIITKSLTGEQVVLPIGHNITKKEVIDFSPSLADSTRLQMESGRRLRVRPILSRRVSLCRNDRYPQDERIYEYKRARSLEAD